MAISAPRSEGWSRLNIALHWLIVLFIVVQFVDHEWMVDMWRATRRGAEIDFTTATWGWVHIVTGTLVLIAALIRLWDRYANGRPPYPAGEPNWALWLAKVTHVLIYAILILMPVTGLLAWNLMIGELAEIHELLWTPLLVLVGLHIAGSLVQHFYFKSDVLRRMLRPAQ